MIVINVGTGQGSPSALQIKGPARLPCVIAGRLVFNGSVSPNPSRLSDLKGSRGQCCQIGPDFPPNHNHNQGRNLAQSGNTGPSDGGTAAVQPGGASGWSGSLVSAITAILESGYHVWPNLNCELNPRQNERQNETKECKQSVEEL